VYLDDVRISPVIQAQPARVTLTSPTANASFLAASTLPLAAGVIPNGDTINGVQFYANTTNLIGQATIAPYTATWTNVPAGTYSLIAIVNFNGGGVAASLSVVVTITNLPPVVAGVSYAAAAQTLSISATGQPGGSYVLLGATNLVPPVVWLPVLTNVADGSGNVLFTNLPAASAQEFYRISGN
jgi:hypothetical protein